MKLHYKDTRNMALPNSATFDDLVKKIDWIVGVEFVKSNMALHYEAEDGRLLGLNNDANLKVAMRQAGAANTKLVLHLSDPPPKKPAWM